MIGFQPSAEKFLVFTTVMVLVSNCGASLGICLAAAFADLSVALSVTPMILLPLMIFSGFFVNNGGIPVYFDWIKYLSPMKYGFSALVQNEFTNLVLTCSPSDVTRGLCKFTRGEQVIRSLGMDSDPAISINLIVLFLLYLGFLLLAYVSLVRVVRNKYSK